MVSIVPNRFRIKGTVASLKQDGQVPDFTAVEISLDAVEHLQGPVTFLQASAKEIVVNVSKDLAASFYQGMYIEAVIRKAPEHYFVLPDSLHTEAEK